MVIIYIVQLKPIGTDKYLALPGKIANLCIEIENRKAIWEYYISSDIVC